MNVYGLIGYPLEHSFSQKYFTSKFRQENIPARFELFPIKSLADLQGLLSHKETLKGLAVTIPYKVDVIPFLSEITLHAKLIGAVNCIEFTNGGMIGHNTDAIGFERSLLPLLTADHTGALILGKGGAALAVRFVLESIGLPYQIVSRQMSSTGEGLLYEQVSKNLLKDYPVVINCTPVGMFPNENDKPLLPYNFLSQKNLLYDLIYNPAETQFLKEGVRQGCATKNGLEMLEIQAEENWKIWNPSLTQ